MIVGWKISLIALILLVCFDLMFELSKHKKNLLEEAFNILTALGFLLSLAAVPYGLVVWIIQS